MKRRDFISTSIACTAGALGLGDGLLKAATPSEHPGKRHCQWLADIIRDKLKLLNQVVIDTPFRVGLLKEHIVDMLGYYKTLGLFKGYELEDWFNKDFIISRHRSEVFGSKEYELLIRFVPQADCVIADVAAYHHAWNQTYYGCPKRGKKLLQEITQEIQSGHEHSPRSECKELHLTPQGSRDLYAFLHDFMPFKTETYESWRRDAGHDFNLQLFHNATELRMVFR